MTNFRLPFDRGPAFASASAGQAPETVESRIDARDRAGRERAVDPRFNVALEASAGTGKTRILVNRYVNLLRAGVDPGEILALTFTRKAAAEMRERIVATLRDAAARGEFPRERWRQLRDRTADVTISTIDAFCLSLLREFPLEADLDPGFSMADETEVPRLVSESLDRALRVCRSLATRRRARRARLRAAGRSAGASRAGRAPRSPHRGAGGPVAVSVRGPSRSHAATAARRGAVRAARRLRGDAGRTRSLSRDRSARASVPDPAPAARARWSSASRARNRWTRPQVHAAFSRAREHFLTQDGQPRTKMLLYKKEDFASATDWQVHRDLVFSHAPAIVDAYAAYRRDLNVLVSRGVWRMFKVAEAEYRRTLDAHAVLDFPDLAAARTHSARSDGGVRAEPLSPRVALPPRARRRVPGHQPRAVGSHRAADAVVGRGRRPRPLRARSSRPSSSSATASSRSTRFETPTCRCSARRGGISRACGPTATSGDRFRAASGRCRRCSRSSTICVTTSRRLPARRDAFQYAEEDRFPIDEDVVSGFSRTSDEVRLKADTTIRTRWRF